jgi:hypothetical protein
MDHCALPSQLLKRLGVDWKTDEIEATNMTDNVVELVIQRIADLPMATQGSPGELRTAIRFTGGETLVGVCRGSDAAWVRLTAVAADCTIDLTPSGSVRGSGDRPGLQTQCGL